MRRTILGAVCVVMGCLGTGAMFAGSSEASGFLKKGTRMVGIGGGVAFGTTDWGGEEHHDAALVQIHVGVAVGDVWAKGQFWQGRLILGGDFLFAQQFAPDSGVLVGVTPMARYVFDSDGPWKPFCEAGFGLALTDIGAPTLGGTLQFSPQGGIGFFWLLKGDLALTAQQRIVHYSNGGLRSPNSGLNQHVFLMGLTRFF